jgi:hypothetical protein
MAKGLDKYNFFLIKESVTEKNKGRKKVSDDFTVSRNSTVKVVKKNGRNRNVVKIAIPPYLWLLVSTGDLEPVPH